MSAKKRTPKHMPQTQEEWNRLAARQAEGINANLMERHRGAAQIDRPYTMIFGNDGYYLHDDKGNPTELNADTVLEVTLLRKWLEVYQIKELGFGLDSNKYTWALIVAHADAQLLHDRVWAAFYSARGLDPP